MAGLFIVFEGITGSGKKTQIKMLEQKLRGIGKEVYTIAFPNFESEIARATKRPGLDNITLALLYAADRAQHQGRIKSLLEKNAVVICDRYCYSNFAYQTVRGLNLEWLLEIEKNIIKPSLVFVIDVPVDTSMRRVQQANIADFSKREILERIRSEREILEKTRESFLNLSKTIKNGSEWHIIDGNKNIDEINSEIWGIVQQHL